MFGDFNSWIIPLRTAAVPFFFMITGYFLYNNNPNKLKERLQKSILKLLPLILICNLFYILLVVPNHGWTFDTWEELWGLILYGDTVMEHLWYLTALLWGLLFHLLLTRILHWSYYQKCLPYLYLLALLAPLGESYASFTGYNYKELSVVPYAIPFLAGGMVIRHFEETLVESILAQRHFVLLSLCLLFAEFTLVCYALDKYIVGVFISTLIFVPSVFIYLLKHKESSFFSAQRKLGVIDIGKRYSGNIYYWHLAAMTVGTKIALLLGIPMKLYDWFSAPIGFAIALVASIIIVKIQDRLGWNVLR